MGSALLLLLSAAAAHPGANLAASPEVEQLLSDMRAAYKSAKSATFSVDVTRMTQQNGRQSYSFTMQYKAPNLFSTDLESPAGKSISRSDGKTIWFTAVGTDSVSQMPWSLDNVQGATTGNLESICFIDWERQLSTAKGKNMETSKLKIRKDVEWNNKKWIVLDEVSPTVQVAVDYYIDPKTHLIHRTELFSEDRSQFFASFKVKEMKVNAKVDEAKFKKPPVVTEPAKTIKI